jgi:SAM-dependent methyltransferase
VKIAYVGNFSQSFCTEVHIAATLEHMGHKVVRLQENEQHAGAVGQKIKGLGHVDLFLWTRTWSGHISLADLKSLREYGIPTASYHLDLYIGLKRESGLDDDPFWRTDYVFTPDGDPASAKVFEAKGINHHYIKPAVFRDECVIGTYSPELAHDVVFVGGGATYGHPEWPYRQQLVSWLRGIYGNRFAKYGHPERTMRGQDLNDLYTSAKVVVGDSLCPNFTKPYYWSDRVYETIGRGGFLIMPRIKGLEEEFTDGENIIFYEFGNFVQLKEQIDFWLEHDYERAKVKGQAQKFVRRDATYHNRLLQALLIIFPQGFTISRVIAELDKIEFSERALENDWIETDDGGFTIPSLNVAFNKAMNGPAKINLGCGTDIRPDWINMDRLDLPGVDVVHNLMRFPYPFDDDSAEEIRAVDVIEHLANYTEDDRPSVVAFIEECYRILKPGGELFIQTPGWDADFLWIDPTHVRGFDMQSMDFFDPDKHYGQTTGFYAKAKFSVRAEKLENNNLRFWMVKR